MLERLGATVHAHDFAEWWRIMETRDAGIADATFVHPVSEAAVIAGNATIGLEIAQDWADVEAIAIPFGGGGLSTGIALALKLMGRKVEIIACEVETSTPLTAAFAACEPVAVERTASFVDGIGSLRVLGEMWPLIERFIDRTVVVSIDECTAAVRETALRHRLVVEGAGAAAIAAALRPEFAGRKIGAVVSGGNIDLGTLGGMIG
jgi:threonine dehydratase